MSEDAGILFQVPTSTFVDAHGRLFAVTHLPLYAGDLLRLYRYVPAPFLLDEQKVSLEIISPAEYLALDTHGMVGKQLTASEFQLCRRLGNVYHCPNMNLVNKDLKSLCLYNIYSQTTNHIEDTCEVKVTYSAESRGATLDLALSNLGRKPGTIGDGLQIWEQRHHHIGCSPFKVNGRLPQGFDNRVSLRPDT